MSSTMDSPPQAPPIKYAAPLGTRWAKEKAAAGGASAFDLPTDPKSIGPWILGECVGKGASGRVKIAKHKRTGQLAAVKILPIAPLLNSRNSINTQYAMYEKFRLGIDREITMMKLMNHPNIMRIYDVFEGETELYLVLEYVEGGELFDFLVNRGRLHHYEALEYFKQIIYGLNYAHTFSIIHRDLKPENILIASLSPPLIKIADWGMAAFAPPSLQLDTSCGSPHYASPEIVNGEKYQGNATDIWSCGVILYALLTGRLPFDDKNIRALLAKVKSGRYRMPVWIDPLAGDLISRMLVVDVAQRITIPEILAHPWLSVRYQEEMKMLKQPAPPLPPSPSLLARPIASPDLVDPELFSSLRIIWGKHADPSGDTIKKDLCSPAGHGVHTKAFYYLLNKYREESYRKRLDDGEDADDMASCNGISRLTFERYWGRSDAKMASVLSRQRAGFVVPPSAPPRRRIMSSPVQPPAAVLQRLTPLPPPMERGGSRVPSRERPALPTGPRPLPYSLQPFRKVPEHHHPHQHLGAHNTQSVGPVRPASSTAIPMRRTTAGPRPQPPRRGYTFSHEPEKQVVLEEKPTDSRTMTYDALGTYEEGRRNTIATVAPASRRKDDVGQTRIPSPTFRPPVSTPPESRKNQGRYAPPDVRSPRTYIHAQVNEGSPVNAPPLALTNPSNGRTQASAKVHVGANQAVDPTYHKATRRDAEPKDHGRKRVDNRGIEDKENQGVSVVGGAPGVRRASGVGLGSGISNTRDVCQEMGNVIYIGTGNTPIAKGKKERKSKPPALDLPVRRSTMSALGSPMTLSSPVTSNNSGSPARLLTSPVIGEFKGWFSSLFNWKSSASGSGQSNVIYSPDDLSKTCVDVARLLETLGVIVVIDKLSDSLSDDTVRLKCRIEELSVDHQANISLKPVRFKVEFKPIQQTRPLIRQSAWSPPLSPITDNACFFLPPNDDDPMINNQTPLLTAPNPGLTPRIRMSMLPVVMGAPSSGQNTPMPSPGLNELHMSPGAGPSGNDSGNGRDIPYDTSCGILLVYEKGSTSSFKTIWRKVKDAYGGLPAKPVVQSPKDFSAFSPIMVSTPVSQASPMGHFSSPGYS